MRNFVIFLQGETFDLEVDGKTQPSGFFATRRVEAETEEAAASQAISILMSEPEIAGKAMPGHKVLVKVVHEMSLNHKGKYSGFTFYPMEEQ